MSEENLSPKSREALKHIRDYIMLNGRVPSVRELMNLMEYKSPRSAVLLLEELSENEFLEKKKEGGYLMIKDLDENITARTVSIPLVGIVACGSPLWAEENIEAMIPVSTSIAKPGNNYFLLRAKGDSMDRAGIEDGDLVLVKQQPTANNGDKVVALVDDAATVKEFCHKGSFVTLLPRSSNQDHQPIILTSDFRVQGIVVATIPK